MPTRGARPALHGVFRQDIKISFGRNECGRAEITKWPVPRPRGSSSGTRSGTTRRSRKVTDASQSEKGLGRYPRVRATGLPVIVYAFTRIKQKKIFFGKNVFFQLGGGK